MNIVLKYNIIQVYNFFLNIYYYNCQKYGKNEYFSQKRGIPQGLNISSVLCSFYFSHLEKNTLDFAYKEYPNSLNMSMRLIDDYLLITTEKDIATKFLNKLLECSKENDFSFNESKIKTNFSYTYNGNDHIINSQYFENSEYK